MSENGGSRAVEASREIREETSVRKVAFASAIGATIGWYDFFLYGTVAALVFEQVFWIVAALVVAFGLIHPMMEATLASFWSELFETRVRYSGLSSIYQFSGIFASGLTPLIATELFAVGKYFDTASLRGEAPLLTGRNVRLDTRELGIGSHFPL